MTVTTFAPNVPLDVFMFWYPCLAPNRPNLSITQLLAMPANPLDISKDGSCVFNPKKAGADTLETWSALLILQQTPDSQDSECLPKQCNQTT